MRRSDNSPVDEILKAHSGELAYYLALAVLWSPLRWPH